MKKTLGVFILCVFLLSSLSVVYAARDGSKTTDVARLQQREQKTVLKLEDSTEREQKRIELREKMQKRVDAAKERKTAMEDAAKTLREQCRAKQTLEGNCGEAFTKIKEHLTKVVDRMIEAFTNLKTKLAAASNADQQTEALTKIDTYLEKLKTAKADITAAKTRAELKKVMTDVRTLWVDYKQFLQKKSDELHFGRAKALLTKVERITTRLEQALAALKTADTANPKISAIETALAAVKAQVVVVRTKMAEQNKDALKDALNKLHDLLKAAVSSFKDAGKADTVAPILTAEAAPVTVASVASDDDENDEDDEEDDE